MGGLLAHKASRCPSLGPLLKREALDKIHKYLNQAPHYPSAEGRVFTPTKK
jgi:hypothetical protein